MAVAELKAAKWRGPVGAWLDGDSGPCKVQMLTGDREESALEVASVVGIDPEDVKVCVCVFVCVSGASRETDVCLSLSRASSPTTSSPP